MPSPTAPSPGNNYYRGVEPHDMAYQACPYCGEVFRIDADEKRALFLHVRTAHGSPAEVEAGDARDGPTGA